MRVIISGPARWGNKSKRNPERAQLAKDWLHAQILILEQQEGLLAASSLHLGLDTFFAALCIERGIPFHAILACKDQDLFWGAKEREVFEYLTKQAEEIVYISDEPYAPGCIAPQAEAIAEWAVKEDDSVILLMRWGPLGKIQRDRVAIAKEYGTLVKTGRL